MTREESIALYKAQSRRLYNISLRIVRDGGLAEEIMQDTILKYLTLFQESPVGERSRTTSWLSKTCIRASIDALRKRKREKLFLEEYANDAAYDDTPVETDSLDIAKVHKAIDELKEPYRLIINLILIEGLDYEEISDITGEQEGTIRTQYSRAKKMLEKILKESNN